MHKNLQILSTIVKRTLAKFKANLCTRWCSRISRPHFNLLRMIRTFTCRCVELPFASKTADRPPLTGPLRMLVH